MSRLSISHQPKLLVENRPNATENRPNATVLRPNATETRPNATLLGHSVHDAKVDLRQFSENFLTLGNRVGHLGSGSISRDAQALRSGARRLHPYSDNPVPG